MMENKQPTLYDVNKVLHDGILVGEDENALTTFVSFIFGKQPVVLMGPSGAGKSVVGNAVWDLIPESQGYEFQMGTSKSIWHSDNLQRANAVYFQEWNKAAEHQDVIEAAKSWGEGKTYTRETTENVEGEWTTTVAELEFRPFLTTIADGNEHGKIDAELGRRVIKLYTDPSMDQTEKVVNAKAAEFSRPWMTEGADKETVASVKRRVTEAMRTEPQEVALPGFQDSFVDKLPMEFHQTRSVVDHYFNVISGVARFYAPERETHDGYILANVQDHFEAFEIYKETLLNNCLLLENLGSRVLTCFPTIEEDDSWDENAMLTIDDVMEELKHQGIMLPKDKVKAIIVQLCMSSYLVEDNTMPTTHYRRSGIAENPDDLVVDWGQVIDTTIEAARESLPDSVSGKYIANVKQNQTVTHPVTGEQILLTDYEGSMDATEDKAETVKSKTKETAEKHKTVEEFGLSYDD